MRDGGCEDVVVVLGACISEVPQAEVVVNPRWRSGLASSLATGLEYLTGLDSVDRVIITLVDEPDVAPADVRQLLASTSRLAAIRYGDQWSHPVLIHSSHWRSLRQNLVGDKGARSYLMAHHDELALFPSSNLAGFEDLDYRPGSGPKGGN